MLAFVVLATLGLHASAGDAEAALPASAPEARPRHTVRAAAETAALLLGGSVWYWRDLDFNSRDWDLRWDWPSWKRKLTLDTVRLDQNLFQTNAVSHPRAGFAHYQVARGNGLDLPRSLAVVAGTSIFWEYVVEYRELASLNDMVVNTVSGVAIGEPFYQLGEFFLRSRPSLTWRGLASALSPIAAANDWVDGRGRGGEATDALGLNRELWHHFQLSAGVDSSRFDRGPNGSAVMLAVDTDLVTLPSYGRSSTFAGWTRPGAFTSISGRLSLDEGGPSGGSLLSRTSLAGHYAQRFGRPAGMLSGHGLLLGVGSAFEYDDFSRPTGNDYLAVMNVLGPIARLTARRGALALRWDAELYADFALVKALGFEGRLPAMEGDLYRPGEHGGTIPGVIGARGYGYGVGATGGTRLRFDYRAWDAGAELRGSRWSSVKGFDRFQEELIREPDVVDRRVLGRAWVGVRPWGGWWRMATGLAWRWRSGSADAVTNEHLDTQVAVALSLVF